MELYPGALIAGRYRIDRKIGAGGMGEVWAGEHASIGVRVAIKTLLPAAALDRQLVARFRREAQLLGRLRSERVARVVDFVEDPEFGLVLVMEFVEGELLGAVLAARRLGAEEAIDLGVDLASALCDLHRAKVVHRDIKPDNVILEPVAGRRPRAVLVDLGVGRVDAGADDAATSLTQADMAVGTLPYMAPEQLLSSSTAGAAADVYALGAILYRAVSGVPVFGDADDAVAARRKLAGDAPPLSLPRIDRVASSLAGVVGRALARDPDRRPSAEQMLQELTSLADLSRALTLDLEAPTEQAPPAFSGAPSTEPSEGEATRRMSRPPIDPASLDDEATHVAPASQSLPFAPDEPAPAPAPAPLGKPKLAAATKTLPVPTSSPPGSDGLNASSIRQTRPTVHSAILAPTPPAAPTLAVVPSVSPSSEPPSVRSFSTTALVVAVVVALGAGAALGFGARGAGPARGAPPAPALP